MGTKHYIDCCISSIDVDVDSNKVMIGLDSTKTIEVSHVDKSNTVIKLFDKFKDLLGARISNMRVNERTYLFGDCDMKCIETELCVCTDRGECKFDWFTAVGANELVGSLKLNLI